MSSSSSRFLRISATKNLKMELGSSSSRKSRNSGHKLCFCGLKASINQAWTDKNPARRFYGCPRFKFGNGCKYFSWFDEEEARDEIRKKDRIIEQLKVTIAEMRSDLEKKQMETVKDEDEIVRQFEECFV
ncbi:hypothetical protein IGI04_029237 [Brassica rapa subsp. trilocularis]|uniref:GRF-type domain-containing protein n=1 Tax=Brassica rapa subsp. trilocularis TaxID=1813537 RepID=A0ABQ7LR80_BRACM|nr:hypothetical protein IGI04_029237 [Brassica rapa subsp. trilocularis]